MSSRARLIATFTVGFFVVAAAVAFWQATASGGKSWSDADRRAFVGSCVEKCRAAPGVTADSYPLCDRACACAADEAQKQMTAGELDATATAISSGGATAEQKDKMNRIQAAAMACTAPVQK